MRWMHLRFETPLASFGGETIDARGVIRDFPSQSMLTGLLANALGWTRSMRAEHQELQNRIVFGALHERDPGMRRMTDYQTAPTREIGPDVEYSRISYRSGLEVPKPTWVLISGGATTMRICAYPSS